MTPPEQVAVIGPYELGSRMRNTDAFAWRMEADPLLRSTIVAVALLDRRPEWERLVKNMERLTRQLPVFRARAEEAPLRMAAPRWRLDEDFDLGYHLRRVVAPAPRTLAAVLEIARTMGMARFDLDRPLWEFVLVEGMTGGRAALVTKLHHSLADGIGGLQLALNLFEMHREEPAPVPMPEPPTEVATTLIGDAAHIVGHQLDRALTTGRAVLPVAWQALQRPGPSLESLLAGVRSVAKAVAPITTTLSPVMIERRLVWHYDTLDVPLPKLRRAAKSVGGSVNDAFLGGVTGGLRRYHDKHGRAASQLRVAMPISMRKAGDSQGGNRLMLVRFTVPAGIEDPRERMREIGKLTRAWQHEPAIEFSQEIAAGLNLLPRGYVGGMLKHVDFLASNVPGFPFPVYVAGAKMLRYYPFGPTIGSAVNVTLLSYCDQSCIGVTSDGGAVPDPDVLLACLEAGFAEVTDLAGRAS